MSKKRLLKEMDKQITNMYLGMMDYSVSCSEGAVPQSVVDGVKEQYEELKKIKERLEDICM